MTAPITPPPEVKILVPGQSGQGPCHIEQSRTKCIYIYSDFWKIKMVELIWLRACYSIYSYHLYDFIDILHVTSYVSFLLFAEACTRHSCATGWHPNAGPPSENPDSWAYRSWVLSFIHFASTECIHTNSTPLHACVCVREKETRIYCAFKALIVLELNRIENRFSYAPK